MAKHDDTSAVSGRADLPLFVARKVVPEASYSIGPEGHLIVPALVPASAGGRRGRMTLPPGTPVTVCTGLALELPDDDEDRYITVERPYGTWVAAGVILVGSYIGGHNGERFVVLYNTGREAVTLQDGEPLFVIDFARRVAVAVRDGDALGGAEGAGRPGKDGES